MLKKGEKTVLSDGMIHIVIKWYHEKLIHPKITTLIKAMKSHFHIWGVENDRFKNTYSELNCEICLSTITLPKPGHYKHIKSFAVLERVQIDLTQIVFGEEDILSKNGYKWVLTVIDCFSKFAWAYPLRSKESKPICDILCELFLREGVPIVLQSDNGGEFVSNIIKIVMPKFGIKLVNGSPYSPTTQGQVERFNKSLKQLLRKEIQIESSNDNVAAVQKWSQEILPKVMDLYIHKQHRSLSRSPWEVYYARPSPHPLKSITQFEPFTTHEVESCSSPNTEFISSLDENNLMDDMRIHSNKCQSMIIQTLTQTRKIQVENHRKISKQQALNQQFEVGMVAYMRNPNISGKKRKRNLHEPVNIKVKILKINSTSNQCYIEYHNLKNDIKRMWVNNVDLSTIGNEKLGKFKDLLVNENMVSSFSVQFNRIKYKNYY